VNLAAMSVEQMCGELASDSPAPGGGSAAALAGAIAASLCAMVSRLTAGREAFREAWGEMREVQSESERLSARLLRLADEDAEAFLSVMAARALPKTTEAEKTARLKAIQEATLRSARVPLETLESLALLASLAAAVASRGNPRCITDAGSAAQLLRAGALGASYNVRVNLPSLADPTARGQLSAAAARALQGVQAAVEAIEKTVESALEDRSRA
jgi:formiminotetrahydrofolate cyclodeaminase